MIAHRPLKSVRVGGALDFVKDQILTPSALLHLVPFVGWPSLFLDMYQGWGIVGKGAELALHAAPGIVRGESVSDALIADYGTRLKLAAGVMLAPVLAGAIGAATTAAGGAAGAVGIDSLEAKAREIIGDDRVDQIKRDVSDRVDKAFNQAFAKITGDKGLQGDLARAGDQKIADLDAGPNSARAVANRFGAREDVAALAVNTLAHRRIYGVTPETYDPATGARIIPIANDRTDGPNSTWALIDLLNAQNSSADPAQIASVKQDYDRALLAEATPTPLDASNLDVQISIAKQRGASPIYIRDLEEKFRRAQANEAQARTRAADQAALVAAAKQGNFGLALPPDRPPFAPLAGRPKIGAIAREIAALALLTVPAWGTWIWLRRR